MSAPDVFADDPPPEFKMGRNRSDPALVAASPQFRRRLITTYLPAPPAQVDWSAKAMASIQRVYMNNQLGCCVISAGFHFQGVATGNAGLVKLFSDQDVIHDYGRIGGYDGSPSSDRGCDMQTALRYWKQTGFPGGNKLEGWLAINPMDEEAVKQSIWLFESLFIAIEMPNAWITPFPQRDGFVWDVAGQPIPQNGHAIEAVGYNDRGIFISTWGLVGLLTWAAAAKYCSVQSGGELYAMLDDASIDKAKQKAPNGLDWTGLVTDFDALGGDLPIPAPPAPPPPQPPPQPPSPDPDNGGTILDQIIIVVVHALADAARAYIKGTPSKLDDLMLPFIGTLEQWVIDHIVPKAAADARLVGLAHPNLPSP